MSKILVHRGEVIMSPDRKGGYRILRDICAGDRPDAASVEAFGDAPAPVKGEVVPGWFVKSVMNANGRETRA